jgi:hypothetical protein
MGWNENGKCDLGEGTDGKEWRLILNGDWEGDRDHSTEQKVGSRLRGGEMPPQKGIVTACG